MTRAHRTAKSGFTLLEISIVLAIAAVMMAGGISIFLNYISTAKEDFTRARMAVIDKALLEYRKANGRLPCPASLTTAITSSSFGIENGKTTVAISGTSSNYDTVGGTCSSANYVSTDTAGGMVPVRTLRLPDEYAFDAWGRRMEYHVDTRHTVDGLVGFSRTGTAGYKYANFVAASTQYLSAASNASLQMGNIDFFIAGWAYFTSTGTMHMLGKDTAVAREYIITKNASERIQFYVTHDGSTLASVQSSGTVTTNRWYFIMAWHDATSDTINVSVDNATAASQAHTLGVVASTSQLEIGRYYTPTSYLNGRLDSWVIGKSPSGGIAGSISTISTWLYNGGRGRVYADLSSTQKTNWGITSWWNFEDTTFADSHGSNTLTNNNAVTVGTALTAIDGIGVVTGPNSLVVMDASGADRTGGAGAVYVLMSHGENGHGAYSRTGAGSRVNMGITNTDELQNCDCTSAAASGTYNVTFVQKRIVINNADYKGNFDDILTYKTRKDLRIPTE